MKIGIMSHHFQDFYKEDQPAVFGHIAECGFDGVDYTLSKRGGVAPELFSRPRSEWTAFFREVRKAMDSTGVEALQAHATIPSDYIEKEKAGAGEIDEFRREIEAAAIIGAPYVVIHPICFAVNDMRREENFAANLDFFGRLEPILREFDIKLGIENMYIFDRIRRGYYTVTDCSLAEDMVRYVDALNKNSDRFVACLDTGHMHMQGRSCANAARILGKRLKLMHVQDNHGDNDDHKAPGNGTIDWVGFAEALAEIGYDGAFSMEVSILRDFALSEEAGLSYAKYACLAARSIAEKIENGGKKQ